MMEMESGVPYLDGLEGGNMRHLTELAKLP